MIPASSSYDIIYYPIYTESERPIDVEKATLINLKMTINDKSINYSASTQAFNVSLIKPSISSTLSYPNISIVS